MSGVEIWTSQRSLWQVTKKLVLDENYRAPLGSDGLTVTGVEAVVAVFFRRLAADGDRREE